MEARQRVQLTSTNSSSGLIALINQRPPNQVDDNRPDPFLLRPFAHPKGSNRLSFAGLVALSEVARPDPIPNSAVKRFRANGTLSQDTGE